MNKILIIYLKLFLIFSLFLTSCSKDAKNEIPEKKVDNTITEKPVVVRPSFESIEGIISLHGNKDSDIVIINAQGGPLTVLDTTGLVNFIKKSETEDLLYVNVHQAQTKKPYLFSLSISLKDAEKYTKESVENLKKVIDYYSDCSEKTIYVLGIGYGTYLVQEFIANNGLGRVKEYLLAGARLDVDKAACDLCAKGLVPIYKYDAAGNYTIESQPFRDEVFVRNMTMLSVAIERTHYTDALSHIDNLKNITYMYGEKDEILGPLSDKEKKFLKNKNAKVICAYMRNHSLTIHSVANELKEIFNL